MAPSDFLVVRPADTQAAQVLALVGQEVMFNAIGHKRMELCGGAATRSAVDEALASCTHLFYFGEGSDDRLGNPALVDLNNIARESRIVIAIACLSAGGLGQASLGQIEAYLGFSAPLFFLAKFAEPMVEALYRGVSGLLRGMSVGESADSLRHALLVGAGVYEHWYRRWHPTWRRSISEVELSMAWVMMRGNATTVTVTGNLAACL